MRTAAELAPVVRPRAEHPISRSDISENTLKVLYRLHKSGFKAYLVGGGVRDLLLGRTPKDFDVATDARPEEIRRVFRNSRVIGRRFRLVHVFFHGEIVEVSTFRREPNPDEQDEEGLLITSDNTYGTPRQDAFRRDFTVNALFYRISDFAVVDYVGGLRDLEQRILRTIGDPDVRFPEDPVRMMRACELAGRLDFRIDRRSEVAIRRHAREIGKASPARLTEELLELLACGRSYPAFERMAELGLLVLFVLHLVSGILVTRMNAAARPQGYAVKRGAGHTSNKSWASTTMIVSGLVVLVFVPLHLVTFKFGAWYQDAAHPEMRDLHRLVLEVFRDPLHVAWYEIAMLVIGFHLWHGFASGVETLGVGSRPGLRRFSKLLAVVIAGGFAVIPVVIFFAGGSL